MSFWLFVVNAWESIVWYEKKHNTIWHWNLRLFYNDIVKASFYRFPDHNPAVTCPHFDADLISLITSWNLKLTPHIFPDSDLTCNGVDGNFTPKNSHLMVIGILRRIGMHGNLPFVVFDWEIISCLCASLAMMDLRWREEVGSWNLNKTMIWAEKNKMKKKVKVIIVC